MNHIIQSIWKNRTIIILIFPLYYLFAGLYIRVILDDPSLSSIDPEYAYFISGLNISEGIFKIIHIDHPGTPLQYLIALVIKIIQLFRSNPEGTTDALANPDLYLTMVSITITLLVAISLLVAGSLVYKKTKSLIYALLIQTVPFANYILYEVIGRIMTEPLMPVPLIAMTVLLVAYIYNEKDEFSYPQLFLMSVILAFAFTLKMTLAPLFFIPLVVVKPWKKKIFVFLLTLLLFFIIAVPVTLQFERFYTWTKNLFLHSGIYGGGEKNIIDPELFKVNLITIIHLQKSFSYMFVLAVIVLLASVLWFRNRLNNQRLKKIKVTVSILLVIVAQTFIVGKHYSPHYFFPTVMLFPLLIFLTIELIKEFSASRILSVVLMSMLVFYLGWHFNQQLYTIKYTSANFQGLIEARKVTKGIVNAFEKESLKIVVTQQYGSPFVEYALHFSTVYSAASERERYKQILGTIFPNTYLYTTWDGNFIYWSEPLDHGKIISNSIPVYLYLENSSEELYQKAIEKVFPGSEQYTIDVGHIFTNSVNGETIYKVNLLQI